MHEALLITEIFDIICQFAAPGTLANFARTCQAFKELSLDELWKHLDTLVPLVSLLPASLWGELGGKMILLQPPSLDHWRLIQKYSSRVTVIRRNTNYARAVDQLLLVAPYSPPPSCMFPKLKVILSSMVLQERTPILRWMTGASLTRLELVVHDVHETTHAFVSSLGTLCPNLTTVLLVCGFTAEMGSMVGTMSRAICQWNHLVRATFNVLDASAYKHISQLRSLTTLKLCLSDGAPSRLQEVELGPAPFPALIDLTITVDDTSVFAAWLCHLRLSPVNLTCNSLESIYLDDFHSRYGWTTVRLDETYPLLAFTRLRSVAFHELCTISMDDHALEEFAAGLPLLEVLHLSRCISSVRGEKVAMPTLKGLFQLVKICPLLTELSIVIDMEQSEWVDLHYPGDGVCNHALSMLILGNSRINDPKRVALILGAVFTALERVDIEDWEHVPLYLLEDKETSLLLWHQVNGYLSDFAIVREQERWRRRIM
ncbi:hypothetical protein PAXRUDRAFT_527071 [Paxillus rubicundulus Ve08.2h10]|uniref:F-box domain-containing protein n=1 Tax=Paxillus rubicundulus Ve08.2h10 TaxID=930991 RepID=A0A0D0E694_9AGAM|nr:hypothetical protein PAXRUDRAFT_527071 [Paxillus rubicundulus Ve08.2h10]